MPDLEGPPRGPRPRPGPPLRVRTAGLLSSAGRTQAARLSEGLAAVGLRPKQFLLMNHIALAEGISQKHLGDRLGLDPSGLVTTIDELTRAGLIAREVHATDRRRHALKLTPAGHAKLTEGRTVAQRTAAELLAGLTDDETSVLHDLLARITDPA